MQTYCTVHVIAKNKQGQFLILQRSQNRTNPGNWNCVTGHIKERESAEDAAIRELKEETNLEGDVIKTGLAHVSDHGSINYVIVPVLIHVLNEEKINIDPAESQAGDWVTIEDERVQEKPYLLESLKRLSYSSKTDG